MSFQAFIIPYERGKISLVSILLKIMCKTTMNNGEGDQIFPHISLG